jgi:uncharacterized protein YfbU (UPF0304 family)
MTAKVTIEHMSEKVNLSLGEKLILLMLADLHDHLKIKSDTNTELVREAIHSGNLWGLETGMSGVFHGHETPNAVVDETVNILTMWERLEVSYQSLSHADKDWLSIQVSLSSAGVLFPGFDGNNESSYISAADFLVNHLHRFSHFHGRKDMNAHMPTLEAYRRMYAVFEPILHEVLNQNFTAAQIAQVLAARRA